MIASAVFVVELIAFASGLFVGRRVRRRDATSTANVLAEQEAAADVHRAIDNARIDAARERGKAWY